MNANTENKRKPIKWSPEALAAADKIVNAATAWQSGRTMGGRKLPWHMRLYAWFSGKLGHNVYTLYELHRNNTRCGVCRTLAKQFVEVVNKRLRLW